MKTRTLIAALAFGFAASGAALAQEGNDYLPTPVQSQKTRAEVITEYKQARDAGLIQMTEGEQLQHRQAFVSTLSRAEVRAQVVAAARTGELRALGHEGYAYAPVLRAATARTASGE